MYGHWRSHGKVAPSTSAEFIKETIGNVLDEINKKKKVEWCDKKMEKNSKNYRQISFNVVEYKM